MNAISWLTSIRYNTINLSMSVGFRSLSICQWALLHCLYVSGLSFNVCMSVDFPSLSACQWTFLNCLYVSGLSFTVCMSVVFPSLSVCQWAFVHCLYVSGLSLTLYVSGLSFTLCQWAFAHCLYVSGLYFTVSMSVGFRSLSVCQWACAHSLCQWAFLHCLYVSGLSFTVCMSVGFRSFSICQGAFLHCLQCSQSTSTFHFWHLFFQKAEDGRQKQEPVLWDNLGYTEHLSPLLSLFMDEVTSLHQTLLTPESLSHRVQWTWLCLPPTSFSLMDCGGLAHGPFLLQTIHTFCHIHWMCLCNSLMLFFCTYDICFFCQSGVRDPPFLVFPFIPVKGFSFYFLGVFPDPMWGSVQIVKPSETNL